MSRNMPLSENIERVKAVMAGLIDPTVPISQLARHFCEDYQQIADGHELNLEGFLQHAQALRQQIRQAEIRFIEHVEQPGKLATLHQVTATKADGKRVSIRVHAFWEFAADGRIGRVEELSRVITGEEEDQALCFVQ